MAEFASAILSFIVAGLASWRRIDQVVNSIKNAPRNVEHWQIAGDVLVKSLHLMEAKIKARQGNLTRPEQNLCKAIDKFSRDFMDDLQKLERTIPARRSGNKYWVQLKLKLQEDHQLLERLSRNIQIFQLSAFGLSLLDPPSSPVSGSGSSVRVTRVQQFFEGISNDNPEQLEEEEQPYLKKWREALYEVADVAAQREFPDPVAADTSPPATPDTANGNEASRRPSGVSATEIRYRFEAAISRSKRMYKAELPILAKKAHEEAVQYRGEMQSIDEHAIVSWLEMETSYVRIIKACIPHMGSYEALAWERLENLKKCLVEQSGLNINPEYCNEQEMVGILCAELRDQEGAIQFLRLSLGTYLSDHDENADKIKRISTLVCDQYESLGQWNELDAFKKVLFKTLLYDPTSEHDSLVNAIDWCHQHGFQATEIEGRLYIPEEYMINSTLLHTAAADVTIQPEVIHQLILQVYHATPDTNGDTPLLVAVQHSNNTVLRALLRITGLVHVRDAKGRTPLHRCDNEETLRLLLEEIKKPIHHLPFAELGFKLVQIDSTDAYGTTALHEACDKGNERMVMLLLHEGANVNLVSGLNETPLMITCAPNEYKGKGKLSRDRRRILELLVDRNADTTYKDERGKPAVTKYLKIRGYNEAEIEKMLSPDPRRRFTRNWGHVGNSESAVSVSGRPSSATMSITSSTSPVELMGDTPTRPHELDTGGRIPRFIPPHPSPGISAQHTLPRLQLAELEGSMSGATAVEVSCGTTNEVVEPSNEKFLMTGKIKSIRRKMRILGG
ncbi:e3 ubiquitin- ligase hace1 [Fusarium longipes]|uniref:E3 ubiquitin-ligase hace1 n=1 Tax=Fusarium longipes TaxID=694270 RepID=A0A395T3K9_9HYPO|nr:e3 ubiquitin- ligase hace1 [Fusarium longipes]